jgi:hypothetical protein
MCSWLLTGPCRITNCFAKRHRTGLNSHRSGILILSGVIYVDTSKKMVTIRQKQRIWELHDFELTPDQYMEYRSLAKNDRENFLSDIGGSPAEYESDSHFKYGVIK